MMITILRCQDVSPNAFSDLMIYDEENILLNSTEGWDGVAPKARAADALHAQRSRWEVRQGAADGDEGFGGTDQHPEEMGGGGVAGWSMVGTSAALALTQEILRQSLEQALKCTDCVVFVSHRCKFAAPSLQQQHHTITVPSLHHHCTIAGPQVHRCSAKRAEVNPSSERSVVRAFGDVCGSTRWTSPRGFPSF